MGRRARIRLWAVTICGLLLAACGGGVSLDVLACGPGFEEQSGACVAEPSAVDERVGEEDAPSDDPSSARGQAPVPTTAATPTGAPTPTAAPTPTFALGPISAPAPTAAPTPTLAPAPTTAATPTGAPTPTAAPTRKAAPTPTAAPRPKATPTPRRAPATPTPRRAPATPTPDERPQNQPNRGAHPIRGGIPCVLQLHGNAGSEGIDRSQQYNGPYYAGGAVHLLQPVTPDVRPTSTWWEYDGPIGNYSNNNRAYARLRDYLTNYVDDYGCGPIFVWGLSAGAMMTAKLYCNGEDFGGRAWAYYIADPPLDEAVLDCRPPRGSHIRTWFVQSDEFIAAARDYAAEPGRACPPGLYCENGRALSPQRYYRNLGMTPLATAPAHLEALFAGIPSRFNAWQSMDSWWAEYDPRRF